MDDTNNNLTPEEAARRAEIKRIMDERDARFEEEERKEAEHMASRPKGVTIGDAPETDEDRAELDEISKKTVYMPVEESPGLSKYARNYITNHAQEISDAYQAGNFTAWVKGHIADIMAKHGDVWGDPPNINTPLMLPLQIFLYVVLEDDAERERLLQIVRDCITDARNRAEEKTQYSVTIAREKGFQVTQIESAIVPSMKALYQAFTEDRIFKLAEDVDMNTAFSAESGQLRPILAKDLQHVYETNAALFAALLAYASEQFDQGEENLIYIHLPSLFKATGADYRPNRPHGTKKLPKAADNQTTATTTPAKRSENAQLRFDRFMSFINPLDRYVGELPNESKYRLVAFHSYDAEAEVVTLSAPYLYKLIAANEEDRYVKMNPSIAERDPAALQIAIYLLQRMRARGKRRTDQDNKEARAYRDAQKKKTPFELDPNRTKSPRITYSTSYASVIRECPTIREQLNRILNMKKLDERGNPTDEPEAGRKIANEYNKRARRAFESAFRILREDTEAKDLPNLRIENESSGEYPTKTNTRKNIVITWDKPPKNAV